MRVIPEIVSPVEGTCMCCVNATQAFIDSHDVDAAKVRGETPNQHAGFLPSLQRPNAKHTIVPKMHQYECGHVLCETCGKNDCPICSRREVRRW